MITVSDEMEDYTISDESRAHVWLTDSQEWFHSRSEQRKAWELQRGLYILCLKDEGVKKGKEISAHL